MLYFKSSFASFDLLQCRRWVLSHLMPEIVVISQSVGLPKLQTTFLANIMNHLIQSSTQIVPYFYHWESAGALGWTAFAEGSSSEWSCCSRSTKTSQCSHQFGTFFFSDQVKSQIRCQIRSRFAELTDFTIHINMTRSSHLPSTTACNETDWKLELLSIPHSVIFCARW